MTGKDFLKSLANGRTDIIQTLLDIIAETASPYCVIGGLAVNAYVEPVVSLDVADDGQVPTANEVERTVNDHEPVVGRELLREQPFLLAHPGLEFVGGCLRV